MKIETLEVAGFAPAMKAMRNPLDSWARSDSGLHEDSGEYWIGPQDMSLSERLQKAGPEHAKHLRLIQVWADIKAPRYWWTEFDTYRAGVEKLSCSTMHTITKKEFSIDDFEHDDNPLSSGSAELNASELNSWRDMWLESTGYPDHQKDVWRTLIQNLPQSYIQGRTVMMSYAALRNIVRQRAGHKLKEWQQFIDWVYTLPYARELIFDKPELPKEGSF